MNKKDIKILSIIILPIFSYILYNYLIGNTYISQVDFISQHFRIAEYFRTLFYTNFNLFPTFAFNLGAGQNIFYLSYHGLFSPITLLSYLFPFIKMQHFIPLSNIVLLILSIIAFYYFLKPKFSPKVVNIITFIFAYAPPLLYHTHRHIMFNNYMFFLILALIGVDLYFNKKKSNLLIISSFLIILTSYYFSVTSLLTICIYALYKYMSLNEKCNIKDIIKNAIIFVGHLFISIGTSLFLLLPTIYTLQNGRSSTLKDINIFNILLPNLNIDTFFYKSYSVGLTAILIIAIIYTIINKKKSIKVLGIITTLILTLPIICYSLNGFMYIDGKCFIPLLPLFCFMIALFLEDLFKNKIDNKLLIITLIVFILIIITNLNYKYLNIFILDTIILLLSILLYKKYNKTYIVTIPLIIFISITSLSTNLNDRLVKQNTLKDINEINDNINIDYNLNYRTANLFNILENVNNVINPNYLTTSIYSSTSNPYYINFYRNIFKNEIYNKDYHTITQTNSILFNMYMANSYLITDQNIIGYHKINNNLYKNDDTFTIAYTNNKLMSHQEFLSLDYPYTIDALMKYTIVDKELPNVYIPSNIELYNKPITIDNLNYKIINNKYVFDIDSNTSFKINLDDEVLNKILLISIDMNYNDKIDTSITINSVKNTLSYKNWKYHNNNYTFHYTLSNTNTLNVDITKGHYEIDNIKIYILDYNDYKNINKNHDKFNITSINNSIKGNINVTKDSYFTTSIPYDKGFTIKVDNKKIEYELVNEAFIGFKLNKGYHNIEISYFPPLLKLGMTLSIISVIIYIILILKKGSKV